MATDMMEAVERAQAIIDGLPKTSTGRLRPPKTRNRARPARSTKSAGWGWTHYFLTGYGEVVGYKIVDNVSFMARWIQEEEGDGCLHLGRATPDPQTDEWCFEEWVFPIDYLVP